MRWVCCSLAMTVPFENNKNNKLENNKPKPPLFYYLWKDSVCGRQGDCWTNVSENEKGFEDDVVLLLPSGLCLESCRHESQCSGQLARSKQHGSEQRIECTGKRNCGSRHERRQHETQPGVGLHILGQKQRKQLHGKVVGAQRFRGRVFGASQIEEHRVDGSGNGDFGVPAGRAPHLHAEFGKLLLLSTQLLHRHGLVDQSRKERELGHKETHVAQKTLVDSFHGGHRVMKRTPARSCQCVR